MMNRRWLVGITLMLLIGLFGCSNPRGDDAFLDSDLAIRGSSDISWEETQAHVDELRTIIAEHPSMHRLDTENIAQMRGDEYLANEERIDAGAFPDYPVHHDELYDYSILLDRTLKDVLRHYHEDAQSALDDDMVVSHYFYENYLYYSISEGEDVIQRLRINTTDDILAFDFFY